MKNEVCIQDINNITKRDYYPPNRGIFLTLGTLSIKNYSSENKHIHECKICYLDRNKNIIGELDISLSNNILTSEYTDIILDNICFIACTNENPVKYVKFILKFRNE